MADYVIWDGINSAPGAGDELNGAGINWPIDAIFIDAAQVFIPLFSPRSWWDDVDICIKPETRLSAVRSEKTTTCVRD